jgi:hypothetical protein
LLARRKTQAKRAKLDVALGAGLKAQIPERNLSVNTRDFVHEGIGTWYLQHLYHLQDKLLTSVME